MAENNVGSGFLRLLCLLLGLIVIVFLWRWLRSRCSYCAACEGHQYDENPVPAYYPAAIPRQWRWSFEDNPCWEDPHYVAPRRLI